MDKLSIIIPVYNAEKYFKKCIDSIVEQTYKNIEIIIVDDGTPDQCGEISEKYAERDSRIKVIHKENGGLSSARNAALKIATGKWVAFVDADDWCDLDYFEKFFSFMKTIGGNKDSIEFDILMACGHYRETNRSQLLYNFHEEFIYDSRSDIDKIWAKVLAPKVGHESSDQAVSAAAPWDKLYRLDFLRANHLMYTESRRYREDIDFNFAVFEKVSTMAGGMFCGYHYRRNNISLSRGYNPSHRESNYSCLSELHDRIDKNIVSNELLCEAVNVRAIMFITDSFRNVIFHTKNGKSMLQQIKDAERESNREYYKVAINSKSNMYYTLKQKFIKKILQKRFYFFLLFIYRRR